jgi:PAS domain S-box-containing protein
MTERVSDIDRPDRSRQLLRWMPWSMAALHAGLVVLGGIWFGALLPAASPWWLLTFLLLSTALMWLAGRAIARSVLDEHSAAPRWGFADRRPTQSIQTPQLDQTGSYAPRIYERMVANLPDGVVIIRNGRIRYCNAAAERLFNASPQASPAAGELDRYIAPHQRVLEAERLSRLQCGVVDPVCFRHVSLLRSDGSPFQAEVCELLLENDGHHDVLLLLRDISESERMRVDLEQANQRLTGSLAHEPALAALTMQLSDAADDALDKVRSLSLALHPLQLETLGLQAAVHWHLSRFLEAAHTRWSLKFDGETVDLSPDIALVAFRIVQEAVNNVARHARASRVDVCIHRTDNALRVEVADDGVGFDCEAARARAQSLGLTSMEERVAALSGELDIASLSGIGTRVTVRLPIADPPARNPSPHNGVHA